MSIQIVDKVERVAVRKLKANPYNPNKMGKEEFASLVHGIESEGFIDPVHVQKSSGNIIDGEHRWKAAKKLKMKFIPVIYLDVDDTQARKLTLALIHRKGKSKPDDVTAVLQEIQAAAEDSLQQLALDTAINQKTLAELLTNVTDEAEVAAGLAKGKGKKNGKKTARAAKPDAQPDVPSGTFKEGTIEGDFGEAHQFPVIFYAPTIEARDRLEVLFFNHKQAEYSFQELNKVVEFYLVKHPKKAQRLFGQS